MALLCSIGIGFWRCPCSLLSQGPIKMIESWLPLTVSCGGEGGELYTRSSNLGECSCTHSWSALSFLQSPHPAWILQTFPKREADTGLYALSKMSGDTFPTLSRTIGFHSRSSSGGASMSHQSPSWRHHHNEWWGPTHLAKKEEINPHLPKGEKRELSVSSAGNFLHLIYSYLGCWNDGSWIGFPPPKTPWGYL